METLPSPYVRISELLLIKERDLAMQKAAILTFALTKHTSQETIRKINRLRKMEAQLNEITSMLLKLDVLQVAGTDAEKLLFKSCGLIKYIEDMDRVLAHDLVECRRQEDIKKFDAKESLTSISETTGLSMLSA